MTSSNSTGWQTGCNDPNRVTHHAAAGSGSQTNAQGLLTMMLTEGPVLGGGAFSRVSIVTEEVRGSTSLAL